MYEMTFKTEIEDKIYQKKQELVTLSNQNKFIYMTPFCVTFGTAALKMKSIYGVSDRFVYSAFIMVVWGLPGFFEKLNVTFNDLLK